MENESNVVLEAEHEGKPHAYVVSLKLHRARGVPPFEGTDPPRELYVQDRGHGPLRFVIVGEDRKEDAKVVTFEHVGAEARGARYRRREP